MKSAMRDIPAGPELDAIIDRVVIGEATPIPSPPRYSTSWDAMRIVVEKMAKDGFRIVTSSHHAINVTWFVTFLGGNGGGSFSADSDTLPRAVCLSALKAREASAMRCARMADRYSGTTTGDEIRKEFGL